MIDKYDEILLGILVIVIGGIFTMLMRHASKIAAHQRLLDRISGQLDTLPATAELVVRKVIEGHELREEGKFDSLHGKIEEVRIAVAALKRT